MSDYHINVFYSDEDAAYVADVPDLKACLLWARAPRRPWRRSSAPRRHGSRRRVRPASRPPSRGTVPRFTRV